MVKLSTILNKYQPNQYQPELKDHLANFDRKLAKINYNITYLELSDAELEKLSKAYLTICIFIWII